MPFIRYIAERPETVVSVVNTGKYPEILPDYLNIKKGCFQLKIAAQDAALEVKTRPHQIFIILLALPENHNPTSLKPEWIQSIFVYSEQGKVLLNNLFGGVCPKFVIVRPDYFTVSANGSQMLPVSNPIINKIPESQSVPPIATLQVLPEQKSLEIKKRSIDEAMIVSPPLVFSSPCRESNVRNILPAISRIDTIEQHIDLLKSAFVTAKKTILISTYGMSEATFEDANLCELIEQANARGVKIYIYCNNQNLIKGHIFDFLEAQNNVCWFPVNTHSKILAVDKEFVAIGSCNWLAITDQYDQSENASFVYRGTERYALVDDLWAHIKLYRNVEFGNYFQIKEFYQDEYNLLSKIYSVDKDSGLVYLSLLAQHRDFITQKLLAAKNRVIICSPFIRAGNFEEDFNKKLLAKVANRGVEIYFVCLPSQIEKSQFDIYLDEIGAQNIVLVPMENIHLKTFIVDDTVIAEGSFNWLSASRDEGSQYHNHEVTFVTEGKAAKKLIQEGFEQSEVGKELEAIFSAASKSKRKRSFY